jgi:hypothetical protein
MHERNSRFVPAFLCRRTIDLRSPQAGRPRSKRRILYARRVVCGRFIHSRGRMSKGAWISRTSVAGLALIALAACSDDGVSPGTSDSFVGAFAASDGTGTESGTFRASWASPATGSIEFATGGTGTISLTGEFTPPSGPLTLSGGGYTFTGSISNNQLSGTYTGPNGSGGFVAFSGAGGENVTVFCGEYTGGSTGEWLLVRSANSLRGIAADDDGTKFELTGSVGTNNSVNLTFPGGSATGSLTSMTQMSGTWRVPATGTIQDSGNWSGSTGACSGGSGDWDY